MQPICGVKIEGNFLFLSTLQADLHTKKSGL